MVLNETAILTSPLIAPLANLLGAFKAIIGGIFGVYILLLVLRWIEYKRFGKVLRDVRSELKKLNKKVKNLETKPKKTKKRKTKKKK